jgi:Baseplate J-like protein
MSVPSPPSSTPQGSLAGNACPCETPQDPKVVTNPPGQPSISYRADDFTGFRRTLLRPLDSEAALGLWRPSPGDLGLQALEWWAYLSDILTFYNERIANETYLRTAQFPSSISGLVAVLGYQPAPGLAATGQVAAVRGRSHPAEPLVLPEGMQISSSATPGVPAQIFEVTSTSAFRGTTNVTAALPPDNNLDVSSSGGPASVLLAGKVTAAKPGDRLVLVASGWTGTDDNWSLATVNTVIPETDPGTGAVNTRVTFTSAAVWGTAPAATSSSAASAATSSEAPSAGARLMESEQVARIGSGLTESLTGAGSRLWWVKGRSPAPSAPETGPATSYALLRPTASAALWSLGGDVISPSAAVSPTGSTANLSTTVRAIRPGDMVLFDGGSGAASVLAFVTTAQDQTGKMPFPEQLSPPAPDIIMPYTALALTSNDPAIVAGYSADPAAVSVRYGFRPVGTMIPSPVGSLPSLPTEVSVPGTFALPAGVTRAFLVDTNGSAALVGLAPGGTGTLVLTPAPSMPSTFALPLAAPFTLYLDLVPVARGVTVNSDLLGSGNAAVANQSFTLQKSPLTYLASGAGWVSTLTVYVDGMKWTEVPTMYGQAPTAQVYVIERSPDQAATVRFGDGVNGARLTSGSGNVVATYRYGAGAASPPAGRLTTAINQQPNLASIQNPVAVSGGVDPQSPADVRANAPASVLSFGRAISAVDYEVVASQAPGVTQARAYWTFDTDRQRNLVKIYVNDDTGGVQAATQALAGADDPNRPVVVSAALPIDLSLSCTLVVDPSRQLDDVVAAATASISDPAVGAFSPARMGIGQWLYRSYVEAALSVPGVVAVHRMSARWTTAPPGREFIRFLRTLDNVADPGDGAYFELLPDNLQITGGYSDD